MCVSYDPQSWLVNGMLYMVLGFRTEIVWIRLPRNLRMSFPFSDSSSHNHWISTSLFDKSTTLHTRRHAMNGL